MDTTTTAPAQPASPTPAPAAPAAPATGEEYKAMSPEAFKARLDRERSAGLAQALKDLGFANADDAKKFLDGARAKAEAEKTELQKAQELASGLKAQADRAAGLEATLKKTAARELAALPEATRKAITDDVGEDPQAQLARIEFLRAAGMLAAPADPKPPNPSTTGAKPGPAPIKPAPAADAYQQWQAMRATNALGAAHFYDQNRAAIEAARPKSQ